MYREILLCTLVFISATHTQSDHSPSSEYGILYANNWTWKGSCEFLCIELCKVILIILIEKVTDKIK